jgi:hypothetical protein
MAYLVFLVLNLTTGVDTDLKVKVNYCVVVKINTKPPQIFSVSQIYDRNG